MNQCQAASSQVIDRYGGERPARALSILLHAFESARSADRDVWQFAVPLADLKSEGVRSADMRSLILGGFVAHAIERSSPHAKVRRFQTVKTLDFGDNSRFVLTQQGEMRAQRNGTALNDHPHDLNTTPAEYNHLKPTWLPQDRLLLLDELIIKRLKRQAPYQELVLASFQELHWDPHIDDPIPPERGRCPKQRLHDTIKRLNRSQLNPLIRFSGDGTGRGICWELRWRMSVR